MTFCEETRPVDISSSKNPFNPSWGTRPPVLAGRHELLQRVFEDLASGPGGAGYHHVFYGPRGVGKTVLLSEIAEHVRQQWDWAVVDYSGTPEFGPRQALAEAAPALLRQLGGRRGAAQRLPRRVEVAAPLPGRPVSASVDLPGLEAHEFLPLLQRLGELAAKRRVGVLFVVDEVQRARARPDLELLGNTVQQLERRWHLPVSMAIAGLPNTPRHLSDACTFFERQDKLAIAALTPDATRVAFLEPLADTGVSIEADAVEALVNASQGYPFAIQLYGHRSWDLAGPDARITLRTATTAIERAEEWLAVNLYEPRWERLGVIERAMLAAMAADGGEMVTIGDIAAALGRKTSQLSMARDALLNTHHMVHSPRYGYLAFDLPGFRRWLLATNRELHTTAPQDPPRRRRSPAVEPPGL